MPCSMIVRQVLGPVWSRGPVMELGYASLSCLVVARVKEALTTVSRMVLRQVTPVSTLFMNRNLAIMSFLPPGSLFFDRWGSDILASSVNIAVCLVLRPTFYFDKEDITS